MDVYITGQKIQDSPIFFKGKQLFSPKPAWTILNSGIEKFLHGKLLLGEYCGAGGQ
jgi:hypothetical protein